MAFLAPTLLGGLLAAGIPIALHFFFRSRYRRVPWAAMSFLLASIEQTSRRLRFQELLLLLLRVAVVAILALALARPTTTASRGGAGEAVDAVFVLDTSLSMTARAGTAPPAPAGDVYLMTLRELAGQDGSLSRFDRARAAALSVLDHLPPHSTVQVIAVSDRATLLGPAEPGRLEMARGLLRELRPTDQTTDLLPGLTEASAALARGPSPNKEVYLFTDMQKHGFQTRQAEVVARLQALHEHAAVHLVQCSTQEPANVTIVGITPQGNLRAGERGDFAVLLRNTGDSPVRSLTVSLEVDGKSGAGDSRAVSEIKPDESRAVLLTAVAERPGRRIITARLQSDDLPADNRFDQVLRVHDQVNVLLIDGAPNERDPRAGASYYLKLALQPFPVTAVPASRVTPRDLAGQDLCVLVNARIEPKADAPGASLAPEFLQALGAFVHDGHGLMIFAGDNVEPEPYNRLLNEQQRLLPMPISRIETRPRDEPLHPRRQSAEAGPYSRFRDERSFAGIDRITVHRRLVLQEPKEPGGQGEARVLLRYDNGEPAIVSRQRPGEGEVLLFTTSANDEHWTDWYLRPSFVPFVLVSTNQLLDTQPEAYNLVAGEPIRWQPPPSAAASLFDLVPPVGEPVRLGYPETVAGRPLLTTPPTAYAGIHRIARVSRRGDTPDAPPEAGADSEPDGVPFAVTPDLRETESLQAMSAEEINQLLGFPPVYHTAGDEPGLFSGGERLRSEWTPWLLVGLLVLVVCEAVLAWACGRAW